MFLLKSWKTVAEQDTENFCCEICDFCSDWENGLAIHMLKKHGQLEQLDGNPQSVKSMKKKFSKTFHYWREGKLGTV